MKISTLSFYLLSAVLCAYIFDGIAAAITSSLCVIVGIAGFMVFEVDGNKETDERENNYIYYDDNVTWLATDNNYHSYEIITGIYY